MTTLIDPRKYHNAVKMLRTFFEAKGFIEVPAQGQRSILAACEDTTTIGTYEFADELWPLPQTGQMWLEYAILKDPNAPGFFCQTTSYRDEKEPVAGRHDLIFPMFEFETHGGIDKLRALEEELLTHLGFNADRLSRFSYECLARIYGVKELTPDHEQDMLRQFGPVVFLEYFPEYTSPFWNMKRSASGKLAHKIDVILYGIETIGSAERGVDPKEMRDAFYSISKGEYAGRLFSLFTRERVERELNEFLALPMIPRCGGGIGMTRIIRALDLLAKEKSA